jgi:uncharacterized protein (TIGR02284 family)
MTTNIEDTAKTLQELTQYEIDGSFIVSQAIDSINNNEIKSSLSTIKQECELNIKELASIINEFGEKAPEYSKDFKGYFMQGYTALRGMTSDQGVLKALHTNIQMLLKAFEKVLNSDIPDNIKSKIRRIYEIDRHHLQYVASRI